MANYVIAETITEILEGKWQYDIIGVLYTGKRILWFSLQHNMQKD